MKKTVEVFFDYACPYCLRAHTYLSALARRYPGIEILWRPCEAHPRPERYGPHSDLLIRGLFFAQAHGADVWAYHERMYSAALTERLNIENIDTVAQAASGLLDMDALAAALRQGEYVNALSEANGYAYEQSDVWAVPAYRMKGRRLDAVEDVGITREMLETFLCMD